MYYETEGMAELRRILKSKGKTDKQIDAFKTCLIALEKENFKLTWEGLEVSPKD